MTGRAASGPARPNLASVDGEIMPAREATISITDDGLVRGDGAFEVVALYDGRPFALEEHMTRLERSARSLRLPVDLELVRAEAWRLLAEAGGGAPHDALRIMVTRGGRRLLMTEAFHELPDRIRLASVTYSTTHVLDGVKSLSYASNMLARRIAQEQGADDALLVTPDGHVLEAPTAAVFWVADGRLMTPPLSEPILASITRALLLDVCEVTEVETSLTKLLEADEIFLASSMREVHPVAALDDREWGGVGPVTVAAAEAAEREIRARLARED